MQYEYADENERKYYTKWKRDLESNAYNNGDKNARKSIAKNLASLGLDIDTITLGTGLSSSEVQNAIKDNI